jgi:hypothetical protein
MTKQDKVAKVMHEWKQGKLTSHGKIVKDYDQAVAIALSEAGLSKYEVGGGIGFIPMDLEEKLMIIAKWGGISIKEVIGILNAMIDSGITDDDLTPKPIKNTNFQREKATEKKIKDIWKEIEPKYNGTLKGNQYYSTIKQLVQYSNDDILKRYKPFRKYQYAEGGGIKKYYDVFYSTKGGGSMVAKNIEASSEEEAKEKLTKQMRASSSFDKPIAVIQKYADGGGIGEENEKKENMNKYEGGGEIQSKIDKLQSVVNSKMLPESVKEKARKQISELEKELHESKETKAEEKAEHKENDIEFLSSTGDKNFNKEKDIQFAQYKDNEIMFEPRSKEYHVDDIMFDSLEKAKKHIDKNYKNEPEAEEKSEHKAGGTESKSEEKVGVSKIKILWAEGDNSKYDKFPKEYSSWSLANKAIIPVYKDTLGNEGYNKLKFEVTFKDGETYDGRLDVSEREDNPTKSNNVIGQHIKEFLDYMSSDKSRESDSYKKEIKDWLEKYYLGLDTKETKSEAKKPGTTKGRPTKVVKAKKEVKAPIKKAVAKKDVKGDLPKSKYEIGDKVGVSGDNEIYEIKDKSYRNNVDNELTWVYYLPEYSSVLVSEKTLKEVKAPTKPKVDRKKLVEKAKAKKKTIKDYSNKTSINQNTGERYKRSESSDKKRTALPLGKRVSADGNVYYENRLNRGDFDKGDKFEKGGEVKTSGFGLDFLKW